MPDQKISALSALVAAQRSGVDELVIVDKSDTTQGPGGTTKRITVTDLLDAEQDRLAALEAGTDAHLNDPTAAHAATAVSFSPSGSLGSTNVQAAIEEVATEAGEADPAVGGDLSGVASAAVVQRIRGKNVPAPGASETGRTFYYDNTSGAMVWGVPPQIQTLLDAKQDAATAATDAELSAHAGDTTAVHGIADTAALILEGDSRLTNARTPTAHTHAQADVTGLTAALAAKEDFGEIAGIPVPTPGAGQDEYLLKYDHNTGAYVWIPTPGGVLPGGGVDGDLLGREGGAPIWITPEPVAALDIPFAPAGSVAATNVQDAIEEVSESADRTRWSPSDNNLIAAQFDPTFASGTLIMTAGTLYLTKLKLPSDGAVISNLIIEVTTAGATLVANQNYGLLYSPTGTLIARTASQHTAWGSTGIKEMALTAESGQSLSRTDDYVYAGVLTWGTGTKPTLRRIASGTAAMLNFGLANLTHRVATGGTSLTAVPAPLTTTTPGTDPFWMGLN